jgi:AGZA family xanthine/uracil permease-like MFS transporter
MTATTTGFKPKLWVAGDLNAFFGFGTNILVNLLVVTGLLRGALQLPDSLVFGRILPATGAMLFISTMYYAWLGYRLAKKTGRSDVCALPSGISVPHMFVVTFVIMAPILGKTHDPVQAWEAGLTWVCVQSFVLMAGGFFAPIVRRITPRAALLGSLAGISITYISLSPAMQIFQTPVIGLTCFAVILASWFGGVRYPMGVPAGLVALIIGTIIAWGSNLLGLNYGGLTHSAVVQSFTNFGFSFPIPEVGHVFSGFKFLGVILVTAIPFGIYDLVEAMDNVESASAAGDYFPTTRVLTADGVISFFGCLMGNPFINAIYIGHPGWKAMGGRLGYSAATGVVMLVLCSLGILATITALVPVISILPILLYIGMLIGSQAFQETPAKHAPAIILALVPQIASWAKSQIDNALGAAGTSAAKLGIATLTQNSVLYDGMSTLGGGATLVGIILGSITVFIIDQKLAKAAAFAAVGAILTFFGLMHSDAIGFAMTPKVAAGYLFIAAVLIVLARYATLATKPNEIHHPHAMSGEDEIVAAGSVG